MWVDGKGLQAWNPTSSAKMKRNHWSNHSPQISAVTVITPKLYNFWSLKIHLGFRYTSLQCYYLRHAKVYFKLKWNTETSRRLTSDHTESRSHVNTNNETPTHRSRNKRNIGNKTAICEPHTTTDTAWVLKIRNKWRVGRARATTSLAQRALSHYWRDESRRCYFAWFRGVVDQRNDDRCCQQAAGMSTNTH